MTAVLVGGLWLVFYAVLVYLTHTSRPAAIFVGNVLYLFPIAAAAGLSVFAAVRTSGRVRIAWRLLAASNVLWLAGETLWAVSAYRSPDDVPVPSVSDIGYFLSYLLAVPAIIVGLGMGLLGRTRRLLDALLVAAGGVALGWQLLIGPLMPSSWDAATITAFIYPVLSVALVSVLAAVVFSGGQRVPRSMMIVGAAFGLAAVTDAAYAYLTLEHEYTNASWLNVGWQAEAVLLCIAALIAARSRESDEPTTLEPDLSSLPAVVAVVAVCGVALADLIVVGQLSRVTVALTLLLLVGLLVRQISLARGRWRVTQRLRTDALTDPLTGLYNRRHFEESLRFEAVSAARHEAPLSVVLVDLDHFKDVNDTYGHAAGDAVLVEVARLLRQSVRSTDLICRYGGEEFACLLPGTDAQAAVDLAERIRQSVCRTPVPVPGSSDHVLLTASFGVATAEPGQVDTGKLVEVADEALYRAKALGRDRVVGSGVVPAAADPAGELPPGLIWLADRVDEALGRRDRAALVSRWSAHTAARLGLDPATQARIAAAARVADIGRITAALDSPSAEQIRRHPAEGARLLVELAGRADLGDLVAAYHERADGSGYPLGLSADDIPVGARIIAVCDTWATMRAGGSAGAGEDQARAELSRDTRFDPAVVAAFLSIVDECAADRGSSRRDGAAVLPAAGEQPK
ncbi:diguanylate cyclase [Catellatospora sp. TT07R-123]|uniref:diguanylate cyclase n=1 Tax=Catellatospora sp. TT07R-123 TaxID=2733863 RepID=UPI001BB3A116|nr:diguanylate cyclase [Catellatospora sp. TT07R-123]